MNLIYIASWPLAGPRNITSIRRFDITQSSFTTSNYILTD